MNKELLQIANEILNAKEKRYLNKLEFQNAFKCIIEVSMNIPGLPKKGFIWEKIFKKCIINIKGKIPSHILICKVDCAGYYALFGSNIGLNEIKLKSCVIEDSNEWGRLVDIDCFENGNKISREEIGLKERKCLICDKPHSICMRNKNHKLSELRLKAENIAMSLK